MNKGRPLADIITQSRLWKSVFRQGYPNTAENQSKGITNSWFLHIHPVKVRRRTLKITYTFGLGVISFFLFVVLVITGAWLMLFHVPSVERAYTSMQDLETSITSEY
ncbi:MAG: hypothetical protein Q8R28_22970 [Dehalococcoidia bacterium]|nr:hypothetical protein [Dehalococcoidia bacterium]